jgi:hypothetical protein
MQRMVKMTSSHRVQRRRDKLRAAGMRPVQIWVPDTRAPDFAGECARQCRLETPSNKPKKGGRRLSSGIVSQPTLGITWMIRCEAG